MCSARPDGSIPLIGNARRARLRTSTQSRSHPFVCVVIKTRLDLWCLKSGLWGVAFIEAATAQGESIGVLDLSVR